MTRFDRKDPRAVPRYGQELVLSAKVVASTRRIPNLGMHNFWRVVCVAISMGSCCIWE